MKMVSEARYRRLFASLMLCPAIVLGVHTIGEGEAQAQELEWATGTDGRFASSTAIATDPRGNSYVTGSFAETTFGAGEDNETVLTAAAGNTDVFVAKFAPDGSLVWASSAGGASGEGGGGVATDPRGNIYVTGAFQETATFGAGEKSETMLSAVANADVFVAKFAPDGSLLWATSAAVGIFGLGAVATDARGNSYVAGDFLNAAIFGAGEENETVLNGMGVEAFVAKYRSSDRNGKNSHTRRGALRRS